MNFLVSGLASALPSVGPHIIKLVMFLFGFIIILISLLIGSTITKLVFLALGGYICYSAVVFTGDKEKSGYSPMNYFGSTSNTEDSSFIEEP